MGSCSSADSAIERGAMSALAWFDVFGYPLALPEVVRYARLADGTALSAGAVAETLDGDRRVGQRDGFYFLFGHERSVSERHRRFRLSGRKLKRARRAARLFGLLPSVRLVALCNSLAFAGADEDSDIDLFLVCRPGTLWTTRLLLAGTLKLLGLRPTPQVQRDRLCLSFFVSEAALDLGGLALPDGDPYLRFWVATLLPLYDDGGVYERFLSANRWAFDPTVRPVGCSNGEPDLGRLERLARQLQLRRFPASIRDLANRDTRVVVTDDVLKFHVNDRRTDFRDEYRRRLSKLGLSL
ncbi:MAG: hypothetical protein ABIJ46_01955 [bacterium]